MAAMVTLLMLSHNTLERRLQKCVYVCEQDESVFTNWTSDTSTFLVGVILSEPSVTNDKKHMAIEWGNYDVTL